MVGTSFRSMATTEDVLFVDIGIDMGESDTLSEVHALRKIREIGTNKNSNFIKNIINS